MFAMHQLQLSHSWWYAPGLSKLCSAKSLSLSSSPLVSINYSSSQKMNQRSSHHHQKNKLQKQSQQLVNWTSCSCCPMVENAMAAAVKWKPTSEVPRAHPFICMMATTLTTPYSSPETRPRGGRRQQRDSRRRSQRSSCDTRSSSINFVDILRIETLHLRLRCLQIRVFNELIQTK